MSSLKVAYWIALLFWLLGWFVKLGFFLKYFLNEVLVYPATYNFFPSFFQNPTISAVFYFLPLAAFLLIFCPRLNLYWPIAVLCVFSSVILMFHINTYNDATFVTSFWAALWLLWLSVQIHRGQEVSSQAIFLVKALVGMVFLGGLVGKLTSEYWNGEVIFNLMQTNIKMSVFTAENTENFRHFAKYLSWIILAGESFLSLALFWPSRLFFLTAPILLMGFMFFRAWQILSVVSCLIGLMLAGLYLINIQRERNA